MYLAVTRNGSDTNYEIRQSFHDPESGHYRYRLVFKLGSTPEKYFELFNDNLVFFDDELLSSVDLHTEGDANDILEELLWDFLPRQCQERLRYFKRDPGNIPGPLTARDKEEIANQVHLFDRRRLYYLHYRAIDQSRISRMREVVCRPLLGQSRDEREYYFYHLEKRLNHDEYFNYVYAIFNLQLHFTQSFARFLPEGLPKDKVGDYLVEAVCKLNRDLPFWQHEAISQTLHPHLVRYLIMFFDYAPRSRSFSQEYIKQFMRNRRAFQWPERKQPLDSNKVMELFGASLESLHNMNKRDLTRLYRQAAMKLHPDQGGDQERFVELTDIYSNILHKK